MTITAQLILSLIISAVILFVLYFVKELIGKLLKNTSKLDIIILAYPLLILFFDITIGIIIDKFTKTDGFTRDGDLIGLSSFHKGALKPAIILTTIIFWVVLAFIIFISILLVTKLFI